MGSLEKIFNADQIREFKVNAVVETGTGYGHSASILGEHNPELNVYTIEAVKEVYDVAIQRLWQYKNIKCFFGQSVNILPSLMSYLKEEKRILFWLDAHFPGADFGLSSYGDIKDEKERIPLEYELNSIISNRDVSNDIILMDDLRIYEDGPFEDGNWGERYLYGGDGIDFIYRALGKTHYITKIYYDQGYILAAPE